MQPKHTGLGFKKKDGEVHKAEIRGLQKRPPLREDNHTSRSHKKEGKESNKLREKSRDLEQRSKESHQKSIFEEEETLEEQGYGVLIRDMKRCIKGEKLEVENTEEK